MHCSGTRPTMYRYAVGLRTDALGGRWVDKPGAYKIIEKTRELRDALSTHVRSGKRLGIVGIIHHSYAIVNDLEQR